MYMDKKNVPKHQPNKPGFPFFAAFSIAPKATKLTGDFKPRSGVPVED